MPRHSPCALHSLTLWSFKNYMSKSFAKLSFTRSALPCRARKNLNFFLSYSTLNCSVFKVQLRIIFASRILSALRKTHSLGNVSFQLTMASRFDLRSKSWLFHFFVHSHLSVLPFFWAMVEMRRVELLTPCLQGRCSPN